MILLIKNVITGINPPYDCGYLVELKLINEKGIYTINDKNLRQMEVYCDKKFMADLSLIYGTEVKPDKLFGWTVRSRLLFSLYK